MEPIGLTTPQQYLADVRDQPKEKVERLEQEINKELHKDPLWGQKIKKVGLVFIFSLTVGVAFLLESIRTIGGLRDKFDIWADKLALKHTWNSHPLSPESAKVVAEKFTELKRIFSNNKDYAEWNPNHLKNTFGDKVKYYEDLTQYSFSGYQSPDYLASVQNGDRFMQKMLEDFEKLNEK